MSGVQTCALPILDLLKTNKSKSMALKSVDDVDGNGFDDELSSTEIAYLAKKSCQEL